MGFLGALSRFIIYLDAGKFKSFMKILKWPLSIMLIVPITFKKYYTYQYGKNLLLVLGSNMFAYLKK